MDKSLPPCVLIAIYLSSRNSIYALHQKYIMNAGGILVNPGIGKLILPQMPSPATARVINKNLFRNTGNDWGTVHLIRPLLRPTSKAPFLGPLLRPSS